MKINPSSLVVIAVTALCASVVSTAPAAVIYEDSFARGTSGSPLALNGTSPDLVNTGGATWTAASGTTTDGTQVIDAPFYHAFLPFTPATGIYTLSASLNVSAATNNWEALGFSPTAVLGNGVASPPQAFFISNPGVAPWVLHTGNSNNAGGFDTSFTGPGVAGNSSMTAIASGYHNYEIILNTEAPQWTVTFERDNVVQGATFTYTTNPTIHFVGFGNTSDIGNVENFTLSGIVVPEPSSVVLFGLAVIGLLCAARRRRDG